MSTNPTFKLGETVIAKIDDTFHKAIITDGDETHLKVYILSSGLSVKVKPEHILSKKKETK